jgi:REP element-mobilizing transposase RayT
MDTIRKSASGVSPFVGRHHARFHDPQVVYHVISRTFQGRLLLSPTSELNRLIAGVLGRAQELFPGVRLFAYAFMSNHFHLMLQGPPRQLPAFIGFLKREISRRWGPRIAWEDGLWASSYLSTALPNESDQVRCFDYIMSQGVKEGFVSTPECWPGIHVAKQLVEGKALVGAWVDGTAYAKAKWRDLERAEPRGVRRRGFTSRKSVRVDSLPPWAGCGPKARLAQAQASRRRIIEAGRAARPGSRVVGAAAVKRAARTERRRMPRPPWWEQRRRFVCWSDRRADSTQAYLRVYWEFQRAFREASLRYLSGDEHVTFPAHAFRPGRAQPLPAELKAP